MTAAIVIFARYPTPGKVKTRLARDTGAEAACAFYKICAEHVIAQALSCQGCTCYLFFSVAEEEPLVRSWLAPLGQGLLFQPQAQSPVLGDRMYAAMASCLALGHSKVLIIGTDMPDLSATIISAAVAALDENQLVFGPAEDGGYYLMGATTMPDGIFQDIKWSTSSVLKSNLSNATRLGLRVAPLNTLPTMVDIDTVEDLERWLARRQQHQQLQEQQQLTGSRLQAGSSEAGGGIVPAALLEAALTASRDRAQQHSSDT